MNTSGQASMGLRSGPMLGIIGIFIALVIPSFTLRIVQLLETESSIGVGDLRGFSADLIVISSIILLIAIIRFLPLWRLKLFVLMFIPLFWCGLTYGNYEHIKALGAMSTWAYISFLLDPTFVNGSLLHASRPILLSVLMIFTVGASWFAFHQKISSRHTLKLIILVLVPASLIFFWTSNSSVADWRKSNHFIHNISWSKRISDITPAAVNIPGLYPYDLKGKPRIELGHAKENVLLLVLEGVSGAYLERVAAAHSLTGVRPSLPALDAFGDNGLVYLNFINHQRQTNRGLYSLICGDLPKQTTSAPKMSEFGASGQSQNCLPEILSQRGYQTTFIQSAPLSFMGKDKFMPLAGFNEVYGIEWFSKDSNLGRWGVDDNILFNRTADYIQNRLQQDGRPWFLSVLTAGTHHPFTVPETFKGTQVPGSFSHAVEFLGLSLEAFLAKIKKLGILDNTLVVITSDESFGRDRMDDLNELLLSQAFGSLTISTPNKDSAVIREPFMQMDVALSILDYLGYVDNTGDVAGRSIFRQYDQPRVLPFANTYLRTSAMISKDRKLVTCEEDLSVCKAYLLGSDLLLSAPKEKASVSDEDVGNLRQIAQRSHYTGLQEYTAEWELIETAEPVEISTFDNDDVKEGKKRRKSIFGDQYLSVAPGSTIRVEIDFDVLGEGANLEIRHRLHAIPANEMPSGLEYTYFASSQKQREKSGLKGESTLGMRPKFERRDYLFKESWSAVTGSRIKLVYTYKTEEPLERLNCNLDIKNRGANPVENISLKFRRAILKIVKSDPEDEEGLTVIEMPESTKKEDLDVVRP